MKKPSLEELRIQLLQPDPALRQQALYEILSERLIELLPDLRDHACRESEEDLAILSTQICLVFEKAKPHADRENKMARVLETSGNLAGFDPADWEYLVHQGPKCLLLEVLQAMGRRPPFEALQMLEKCLLHSDPSIRQAAVLPGLFSNDMAIVSQSLALLRDPSEAVGEEVFVQTQAMTATELALLFDRGLRVQDSRILHLFGGFLPLIVREELRPLCLRLQQHADPILKAAASEALQNLSRKKEEPPPAREKASQAPVPPPPTLIPAAVASPSAITQTPSPLTFSRVESEPLVTSGPIQVPDFQALFRSLPPPPPAPPPPPPPPDFLLSSALLNMAPVKKEEPTPEPVVPPSISSPRPVPPDESAWPPRAQKSSPALPIPQKTPFESRETSPIAPKTVTTAPLAASAAAPASEAATWPPRRGTGTTPATDANRPSPPERVIKLRKPDTPRPEEKKPEPPVISTGQHTYATTTPPPPPPADPGPQQVIVRQAVPAGQVFTHESSPEDDISFSIVEEASTAVLPLNLASSPAAAPKSPTPSPVAKQEPSVSPANVPVPVEPAKTAQAESAAAPNKPVSPVPSVSPTPAAAVKPAEAAKPPSPSGDAPPPPTKQVPKAPPPPVPATQEAPAGPADGAQIAVPQTKLAETILSRYPSFIAGPLSSLFQPASVEEHLKTLKTVIENLTAYFLFCFIQTYLFYGERKPKIDQAVKESLKIHLKGPDALRYLNILALSLRDQGNRESFFSFVLSKVITEPSDQNPMFALKDLVQFLNEPPADAAEQLDGAADTCINALAAFKTILSNRLVFKTPPGSREPFFDLTGPAPTPLAANALPNLDLPNGEIIVLSRDRSEALGLFPYFRFDGRKVEFGQPSPQDFTMLLERLELTLDS